MVLIGNGAEGEYQGRQTNDRYQNANGPVHQWSTAEQFCGSVIFIIHPKKGHEHPLQRKLCHDGSKPQMLSKIGFTGPKPVGPYVYHGKGKNRSGIGCQVILSGAFTGRFEIVKCFIAPISANQIADKVVDQFVQGSVKHDHAIEGQTIPPGDFEGDHVGCGCWFFLR